VVTTQYNVIEDHNITLSCNVSGVPDVYDVSWTMDTTSGSVNSDRLTGGTITDPSLTVEDTELGDTGWYTCSATNLAGTTDGKPLHLNVTESKILLYVCLFDDVERHFLQYFSYIVAVSFIVGGKRRTRRKQPTCHKSLTTFIT